MNQRLSSPRTLIVICCYATALTFSVACVKLPRRVKAAHSRVSLTTTEKLATQTQPEAFGSKSAPARPIDINRATSEELAQLPGIGRGFAARIVEHRARYGAFRRTEHLLMVRGISERRFARLRPFVVVE